MTERLEQQLPGLLNDLYMGPMPSYRDNVLQQTARTRQRPAWSFPERWLSMFDIARQPAFATRLPLRTIGLVLVLVALLIAMIAAVLIVGSPPPLPKPFGLAFNGLVAYDSGGDIFTVDHVAGNATPVVRGPETDLNPRWSRDGTLIAFERKATGGSGAGLLYVAKADGTDLIRLTPDPLPVIDSYAFSPDGTEILISAGVNGVNRFLIAATDGSRMRDLGVSLTATDASWRPPDGSEILFMDTGDLTSGDPVNGRAGIYAVSAAGGRVRTILAPAADLNRGLAKWSPDGSQISYGQWVDSDCCNTVQTHVMAADGTGDHTLPMPPGAQWQTGPLGWSNDGTRLFANRGYTGAPESSRPVAVPADGSGFGIEIDYPHVANGYCCQAVEWAPDDSWILATSVDASEAALGQVLLDPVAGTSRALPWTSVSDPAWQRRGH